MSMLVSGLAAGKTSVLPIGSLILLIGGLTSFYELRYPLPVHESWKPKTEYDFIIVGGGSAGSVLANRLSELSSASVLLLEAGGQEHLINQIPYIYSTLQGTEVDWQFKSTPQKHACLGTPNKTCNLAQGKIIGGTSSINGLVYTRGNRRDYDKWAELVEDETWSYKNVLPYFIKSENNTIPNISKDVAHHGTKGYLTVDQISYRTPVADAFVNANQEFGFPNSQDYNAQEQLGFHYLQATSRDGARCSVSKAFLTRTANRTNLDIVLMAYVTQIIVNEQKTAGAVLVMHNKKLIKIKAKSEIILASGVFQSPKLLMLSGIGEKQHLQSLGIKVVSDLPGVGSHLLDHPVNMLPVYTVDKLNVSLQPNRVLTSSNTLQWALNGTGPMTVPSATECTAFLQINEKTNSSNKIPDVQISLISLALNLDEPMPQIMDEDGFALVVTGLSVKSQGQVRLKSVNPFDHPLIDPMYLSHPDDRLLLQNALELTGRIAKTKAFQELGAKIRVPNITACPPSQFRDQDTFLSCVIGHTTQTGYHFVGTNKMGAEADKMAVVDSKLKVRGVHNLRVVDASVMPTLPHGNPNAPTIMIAEKASDFIKQDWLRAQQQKKKVHW